MAEQLKLEFRGRTISFQQLFNTHFVKDKNDFDEAYYKQALKILEENHDIIVDSNTRSREFKYPDSAIITFKSE